jgi:hypothetical protein
VWILKQNLMGIGRLRTTSELCRPPGTSLQDGPSLAPVSWGPFLFGGLRPTTEAAFASFQERLKPILIEE